MSALIIDGKEISRKIREDIKQEVESLKVKGTQPGLATILVGNDPASKVYVGMKQKACHSLGIYSEQHDLPEDTTEESLLDLIDKLNGDDKVNGILCQLPLPKHINTDKVLLAISSEKDVDGFHLLNMGKLLSKKSRSEIEKEGLYLPCTPNGIMELLHRSGITVEGSEAVVVGRSNIVGKPVALLLMAENATVTICHSRTKNLGEVTKRADILVAAIGKPKLITREMVKEGVVVIDVGVNRTEKGIVGDVDFEEVKGKARAITPVPGGVGPMTITMLMANTVKAAKRKVGLERQ